MTIRKHSLPKFHWLGPGELARAAGTTIKALRVYEKAGLLTPDRRQRGWRVYGPEHVARLHQILALKALGLSLKEVRVALGPDGLAVGAIMNLQAARLAGIIRTARRQLERIQDARDHLASTGAITPELLLELTRDLGEDVRIDTDAVRSAIDSAMLTDAEQHAVRELLRRASSNTAAEAAIVELLSEAAILAAENEHTSPRAAALADRWLALAANSQTPLDKGDTAALAAVAARLTADPSLGETLSFLRAAVRHRSAPSRKG